MPRARLRSVVHGWVPARGDQGCTEKWREELESWQREIRGAAQPKKMGGGGTSWPAIRARTCAMLRPSVDKLSIARSASPQCTWTVQRGPVVSCRPGGPVEHPSLHASRGGRCREQRPRGQGWRAGLAVKETCPDLSAAPLGTICSTVKRPSCPCSSASPKDPRSEFIGRGLDVRPPLARWPRHLSTTRWGDQHSTPEMMQSQWQKSERWSIV